MREASEDDRGWLVEWRIPSSDVRRMLLLAHRVRDAAAARKFAMALGHRAFAGEFRLSAGGRSPIVTSLAALREWDGQGVVPDAPNALWSGDLRRGRDVAEFLHALRRAVGVAAAAGVLTMADGLALVTVASTLMAD